MKKIFVIVIIILVVIIAAVFLYSIKISRKTASQSISTLQTPPAEDTNADKITIHTSQGDVTMNNIRKNPMKLIPFDGSVLFRQTNNYDMYYYPPDNGFVITLMNSDLQKSRAGAENDFVEALGVTKDQVCQLKVTLNVPFDVSQEASGKNYGLSFCPDGKPFPAQ